MKFRKIILLKFSLLVLVVCFLSIGKRQERPPDIILISIDTWRADYFTPERMPMLYDFASKNCLIYTNAHSNSTWTKPSHLTMLTGLLQSEHGVEYDGSMIPPSLSMVQEKLRDAGYTTAAFVGAGYVNREWGFHRGFDTYWQRPTVVEKPEIIHDTYAQKFRRQMESFERAERYVADVSEQPIFLFVHTYLIHEYWYKYFPQDRNIGEIGKEIRLDKRFTDLENPFLGKFMNDASPEEMRDLYRQAVMDCDKRLTQFLSVIRQSPRFADAKIIITSDHGEGLGDMHEGDIIVMHATTPYAEQTHIPLITYGFGVGKKDQLVGIDDIAGTILKLAGVEENPPKSLFRERDYLISEYISHMKDSPNRSVAVISDKEKYILAKDGNLRWFQDPQDRNDLIDSLAAPFFGWTALEGLDPEGGPFPQWDLPVVRWGLAPRTELIFDSDGGPLVVSMLCGKHQLPNQKATILLNGEQIARYEFTVPGEFRDINIPINPKAGTNRLTLEYQTWDKKFPERPMALLFKRLRIEQP